MLAIGTPQCAKKAAISLKSFPMSRLVGVNVAVADVGSVDDGVDGVAVGGVGSVGVDDGVGWIGIFASGAGKISFSLATFGGSSSHLGGNLRRASMARM